MRYLKKFESYLLKYKIGDYLFLKGEYFGDGLSRLSKVIDVDVEDKIHPYEVRFKTVKPSGSEFYDLWARTEMIERELTQEEIKEFETFLEINKFNI